MDNGGGSDVLLLSMCFMSFCVDSAFVAMFEYSYKRKKCINDVITFFVGKTMKYSAS